LLSGLSSSVPVLTILRASGTHLLGGLEPYAA
jgi:hypothetical protein